MKLRPRNLVPVPSDLDIIPAVVPVVVTRPSDQYLGALNKTVIPGEPETLACGRDESGRKSKSNVHSSAVVNMAGEREASVIMSGDLDPASDRSPAVRRNVRADHDVRRIPVRQHEDITSRGVAASGCTLAFIGLAVLKHGVAFSAITPFGLVISVTGDIVCQPKF